MQKNSTLSKGTDMQQIKTIIQNTLWKDTESKDAALNAILSNGEGWRVLNVTVGMTSEDLSDMRIFTLIRDIPDATKAQDAPQSKPREFRVGQSVSATLYGEIAAINGYEIKVDFDEFAQPIVCVAEQLEPLDTD
jgi:hypothetical protein